MENALKDLGLDSNEQFKQAIDIAGKDPEFCLQHIQKCDIICKGITPEDAIDSYRQITFDVLDLIREFTKACPDFKTGLAKGVKSMSLEFSCLALYKIGPDSRRKSKITSEKKYKLRFIEQDKASCVFICTFRNVQQPDMQPKFKDGKLILSVKQASLIALIKLMELIKISMAIDPGHVILTPLAGAVYSKQDIFKMAEELKVLPSDLICCINASCQNGGQYLQQSQFHCAIPCVIVGTRNMTNTNARQQLVNKTVKQYLNAKKVPDMRKFQIYSKYATGGIPVAFQYQSLMKNFNMIRNVQMREMAEDVIDTLEEVQSEEQTTEEAAGGSGTNQGN